MKSFRNATASVLAGVLVTLAAAPRGAFAADYEDTPHAQPLNRCAAYGPGFVEVGNGVCGRVTGRVDSHIDTRLRVDMGASHAALNAWSSATGTSNAAMRTDGAGMLPGASDTQHLRVRNGLDSYNPFH